MDSTISEPRTSAMKRKSPETFGEASKRIRLTETTISGLKSRLLDLWKWYLRIEFESYRTEKIKLNNYFNTEHDRLSLLLLELMQK